MLNLEALSNSEVQHLPYHYFHFTQFLDPEFEKSLVEDFPDIPQGGSYSLNSVTLKSGPLRDLIKELESPVLRNLIGKKLDIDLTDRPPLITLRAHSRARDGEIHTDSKSKLVTVLIYLNPNWTASTGKLRILYDNKHFEPYAAEISPEFGNTLIFKVSDNCWHGYLPYEGPRRSIQLNYVVSNNMAIFQKWRHSISAFLKKFKRSK